VILRALFISAAIAIAAIGAAPAATAAPMPQRVFENRQVRASRLVMVVIMARWTMASWWSGLVS
jgi:hypothetical protein